MAALTALSLPVAPPYLGPHDVHVWSCGLDASEATVIHLATLLSSDERERAHRFHFRRDRNRFIVGRSLLRIILGGYLNDEPARLAFTYSPYRKPALVCGAGTPASEKLHFNLSHSDGLVVYALTRGREVGIDLERVRELDDAESIAKRFFSRRENHALARILTQDRSEAFFRCWTRKEAYIKASGEGLSLPLDSFDVTVTGSAALLRTSSDDASSWSLFNLDPATSYVGALAVRDRVARISAVYPPTTSARGSTTSPHGPTTSLPGPTACLSAPTTSLAGPSASPHERAASLNGHTAYHFAYHEYEKPIREMSPVPDLHRSSGGPGRRP